LKSCKIKFCQNILETKQTLNIACGCAFFSTYFRCATNPPQLKFFARSATDTTPPPPGPKKSQRSLHDPHNAEPRPKPQPAASRKGHQNTSTMGSHQQDAHTPSRRSHSSDVTSAVNSLRNANENHRFWPLCVEASPHPPPHSSAKDSDT
jgi:hypothetical protein